MVDKTAKEVVQEKDMKVVVTIPKASRIDIKVKYTGEGWTRRDVDLCYRAMVKELRLELSRKYQEAKNARKE